ncbi:MAG TPA: hypothetical protein VFP34_17020 [Microlunatus sp.]|nr:hypothetical protein [Microlunatus sp.]
MARDDPIDLSISNRRDHRGENRIPPAIAVLVAAATYALLPEPLLIGPRFILPVIELALLVALVITNPVRFVRQTQWSRILSTVLAAIVIITNLIALGILVAQLVTGSPSAPSLLMAAMQVWLTNVIGFALLYWELDRGGPVARRTEDRSELPPADWRFSQDENDDAVTEVAVGSSEKSGWVPIFVDYLYLSVTNSSAFSPTDTMPLSTRAKALMAIQATSALLVTLIVIARAVGSITG